MKLTELKKKHSSQPAMSTMTTTNYSLIIVEGTDEGNQLAMSTTTTKGYHSLVFGDRDDDVTGQLQHVRAPSLIMSVLAVAEAATALLSAARQGLPQHLPWCLTVLLLSVMSGLLCYGLLMLINTLALFVAPTSSRALFVRRNLRGLAFVMCVGAALLTLCLLIVPALYSIIAMYMHSS